VLQCVAVCRSVMQCVAVCCSALQCVAVCCSMLQRDAVCCSVLQCTHCTTLQTAIQRLMMVKWNESWNLLFMCDFTHSYI